MKKPTTAARYLLIVIVAIALATAGAIGVILTLLINRTSADEVLPGAQMLEQTRTYLQALEDGDAATALALTDVDREMVKLGVNTTVRDVHMNLLADEVYTNASEWIQDGQIQHSWTESAASYAEDPTGIAGSVDVSYRLDGNTYEQKLRFYYQNNRWVLAEGLISILSVESQARADAIPFTIGGKLSTEDATCNGNELCWDSYFAVFPAVYDVQPIISHDWVGSRAYQQCLSQHCNPEIVVDTRIFPTLELVIPPSDTYSIRVEAEQPS